MATCRDCKLWNRDEAKDKAGRIRKDRGAKCLWESTEVYPASVREYLSPRRPITAYMTAEDGKGCKRFVKFAPNGLVSREPPAAKDAQL